MNNANINNPPVNWENGFTKPHKLVSGEQPFLAFGEWHLYIYNTETNDFEVYNFRSDLMVPYGEFQKVLDKLKDDYMRRRNNEMAQN